MADASTPSTVANGKDVSQGAVAAGAFPTVGIGLREYSHRFSLQWTAAVAALIFAAVFAATAIYLASVLVHAIADDGNNEIHWHASIIVAAFVIPPTLLVINLVRAIYTPKDKEPDAGPALAFVKEIASSIASIFKSIDGPSR